MKLFHFLGMFTGGPGLASSQGGFYESPEKWPDEKILQVYGAEAKKAFAAKGRPDAEPALARTQSHYEMPERPQVPAGDTRPLQSWKVKADMVIHDVRFGATLSDTFQWPEEPKGAVLNKLIFHLAACTITARGDDPGHASEAEISGISVTPVAPTTS